jgi:uncharacterized protein YraI
VESLEIDLNYFNGDAQAFADRFNVPVPEDPVPPEDPVGNRYRVTAGSLYVREGPGTNYPSIGFFVRNDIVEALASNPDGSWFRARRLTDGLTGWSSAAYLEKVTSPPPPPPPPGDGDFYRVTAGSLYVREGPGTNFPTVGFLVRNDTVQALEANSNGSWLRVRRLSDGLTGWSSATYLEKITPPPPPPGDGERYRVTANSLYVRQGPGTSFPTVGYLVRNDVVEALEANSNGTWLRIRRLADGLTGWASAAYLEKLSALPPPPQPPPSDDQRYRVTATRLHVREGPGTEHPSLGYVELNEIVTAIGANDDETWRQIKRSDGLTGWSSTRYLVLYEAPTPDPNEPPPDADAGDWYQVTGARLNAREGPGVNFPSKGYLVRNEAVQAFSISDDKKWIHFRRVDGMNGWASLTSLKKLGKTPASVMQKLFKGVTYYRNEKNSPRKVISHVLVIDTRTEGLRYLVTPPLRDIPPQLCSRTVSQFLAEQGMQIAVNADGFRYFEPDQFPPGELCPGGGDPVSPLGYAASRGKVYSEKEPGTPILYINQNNQISIDKPVGKIYNAIAGDVLLVAKGKKVSGLDKTLPNPRTAFGMNQNGRWVYLVVVDGRSISKGLTFDELADLLIENGAYSGIALDGGGSSTMVVEGVDGLPRVLNTPIDEGIPGKERAIANHLGIAFKE